MDETNSTIKSAADLQKEIDALRYSLAFQRGILAAFSAVKKCQTVDECKAAILNVDEVAA